MRVDGGWTAANIAAWADQQAVLAVLEGRHGGPEGGLWQSLTHWMGLVSLGFQHMGGMGMGGRKRDFGRLLLLALFGYVCVCVCVPFFFWGGYV